MKRTEEELKTIYRMAAGGSSPSEIRAQFPMLPSAMSRILRKFGFKPCKRGPKIKTIYADIQAAFANGTIASSQSEISRNLGVSRSAITQVILRNKTLARSRTRRAIKKGILERPPKCSKCKFPCRPEAHHDDYEKPMEVKWLCKKCHSKIPVVRKQFVKTTKK